MQQVPQTGGHDSRRDAIRQLLRSGEVRRQAELTRLLQQRGYSVTQSSVSRDLRELGVLKASGRYLLPSAGNEPAEGDFGVVARFVRTLKIAGSLIVLKTAIGAAQSVAVAIDKAEWSEAVGTISGDDTIFIATPDRAAQRRLLARLQSLFRV